MTSLSDDNKPELITIRTFSTEFEALVAKSALEAAGVDCMLSRDDCGGLRPSLTMAQGIKLVIRSKDAAWAHKVLSG
jgi:hypothetical protein